MWEALFLISNPGKADSPLVALEDGWVILEKYTCVKHAEPACLGPYAALTLSGG